MKVQFSEIPDEGLFLEIHDQAWFPDQELVRSSPAQARVFLKKKGNDRVLMTSDIKVAVTLSCDRCLEEFTETINQEFRVDLEMVGREDQVSVEHSCCSAEMDTLFLQKPEIEIYSILRQQIFLLIPVKKICTEKCRGFCPKCGANLNNEVCRCKPEDSSSPFAVLADFKKKGS
jgi:uncharacterized protein